MKKVNVLGQEQGQDWALYHGDCIEVTKGIPDNSIHYSIFSPPFASLYVYSNSDRDMGNCKDDGEFSEHFQFLVKELHRVIMPGRLVSFHCMNLPTSKARDGYIGIKDFRGDLIRAFRSEGFIFHSEVCIWKDPVTAMQRTKAIGLLHKQVKKDSSLSRQGIPDYLVTMRKPGDNPEPVSGPFTYYTGDNPPPKTGTDKDSINIWQRYASPVWMDINPSDTLQYRSARDNDDERHVCLARDSMVLTHKDGYKPIQDVNIGDLVLTHKGRWMPVIAKEKTSDSAKVVSVRAAGVYGLKVTPDHKLWAKKLGGDFTSLKSKVRQINPEWIEAQDLQNSYVNLKLPPVQLESESSKLSEQEWWIVGRWLADGHWHTGTTGRTSIYISGGNHKLDELLDHLGELAGTSRTTGPTCTQIRVKDPDSTLRNILSRCGKLAHLKRLPPEAYSLPVNLSKALLHGYLSGDGHFNKSRKRWYASSTSKELLMGLQFLVQRVYGVTSTIHPGKPDRKGVIQGRTVDCKQDWVMSFQSHGYSFSFVDEDGAWKRVKSVEDAGYAETWNLRVLEDASYTAENCIVKNCPLQLQVIERGLQLWTNPGDVVLDPFNGIGSTGYVALKCGRKYVGVELKDSYYKAALTNLRNCAQNRQQSLFSA